MTPCIFVGGYQHFEEFSQSYRASWYYQSFITNWCTRELL